MRQFCVRIRGGTVKEVYLEWLKNALLAAGCEITFTSQQLEHPYFIVDTKNSERSAALEEVLKEWNLWVNTTKFIWIIGQTRVPLKVRLEFRRSPWDSMPIFIGFFTTACRLDHPNTLRR